MYNLNYLQNISVEKIQPLFPEKTRSQILTILSKALGYNNFGHLKREYHVAKNGNILDLKNKDKEKTTIDLSCDGFIFNEYLLSSYFNIKYDKAFKIKLLLDKYKSKIHELDNYEGNIRVSDLGLLQIFLSNYSKLSTNRIMATFPFNFYCRRETNYRLLINGKYKMMSFFWFDGFHVSYSRYFKGNLNLFIERFLKEFLIYDNIIFLKNVVESYQNKRAVLFEDFIRKYKPMNIKAPGAKFGEDVVFISKIERK